MLLQLQNYKITKSQNDHFENQSFRIEQIDSPNGHLKRTRIVFGKISQTMAFYSYRSKMFLFEKTLEKRNVITCVTF